MGDRTWTGIQFSGIVTREVAEELLDLLDMQCCGCHAGPELGRGHADNKFQIEHLAEPHNQFYDDECNYATMEDIESFCREHHVSYFKSWQAGGDYGPGMEIYHAIVDQAVQCSDIDGEPVIGLDELIKAYDKGEIDDKIKFLRSFKDWEANFPPIVIQDAASAAA